MHQHKKADDAGVGVMSWCQQHHFPIFATADAAARSDYELSLPSYVQVHNVLEQTQAIDACNHWQSISIIINQFRVTESSVINEIKFRGRLV